MDTFVTEKHLQQHYRMRSFKGECFWAHFALFAIKREIQRALSEVTSLRNVCRLASTTNPENIEYTRLWTVFRWLLSPTQNQAAHHSPCTHHTINMYTLLGGQHFQANVLILQNRFPLWPGSTG